MQAKGKKMHLYICYLTIKHISKRFFYRYQLCWTLGQGSPVSDLRAFEEELAASAMDAAKSGPRDTATVTATGS